MAKILFLDQDAEMGERMTSYLEAYGHQLQWMKDAQSLDVKTCEKDYDLIIIQLHQMREEDEALWGAVSEGRKTKLLYTGPSVAHNEEILELRKRKASYIIKYKSPEKWAEKIKRILGEGENEA